MLSKTVLAVGALASMAAAIPMQQNKRDVVWTTKTEAAVTTVDVTTTIWLNPGETAPAVPVAPVDQGNGQPGHFGHHQHGKPKVTSHIRHTVTVPAAPANTETYAAPSSPAAPETPSSPYVAPTPTSTYVAPPPSSPAPVETEPAAPAETYTPPPPPAKAPSNGGGSGGGSGDMTYYTPGMGSCGVTNTDSDSIVALAENMMLANWPSPNNPNLNPLCGKSIMITWNGKSFPATIQDTCPGCADGGLDLTPSLFQKFADLGEGRLTGMTWKFT